MHLNRRSSTWLFSAAAALAALVFGPSPAHATCLLQCKAALAFSDCELPNPPTTWPLGTQLSFTGTCEQCCAAPGGPVTCNAAPMDPAMLKMFQGGDMPAIPGTFAATDVVCGKDPLFTFDGVLEKGEYHLAAEFAYILDFEVVDAPAGTGGAGGSGAGSGGAGGAGGADAGSGGAGGAGGKNESGSTTGGAGGSGGDGGDGGGDNDGDVEIGGCAFALSGDAPSSAGIYAAFALALAGLTRRRARRPPGARP